MEESSPPPPFGPEQVNCQYVLPGTCQFCCGCGISEAVGAAEGEGGKVNDERDDGEQEVAERGGDVEVTSEKGAH